jgi:hypothetical protein
VAVDCSEDGVPRNDGSSLNPHNSMFRINNKTVE